MENQSRVQKIEEALEHLKYKQNILEFEQPRVDVTDQDAEAEAVRKGQSTAKRGILIYF